MHSDASTTAGTSLIARLQDSDPVAWQQLVDLYAPLIFRWCQNCGLNSSDSSDIMQEVFVAVTRSVARFAPEPDGSFRGWLWVTTHNKIRDFARKQKKQVLAAGGTQANLHLSQIPLDDDSLDEPTSPAELNQLLHRALRQIEQDFAPHTWLAFWQTTIEGDDTRSVAERLSMSINSVRQAKSRVLRRLREQLGDA